MVENDFWVFWIFGVENHIFIALRACIQMFIGIQKI